MQPRLPDVVTDIVAENGNSLYQPLVDEYIAGGDVPITAVRQAWRNDLLAQGAYSTFYEQAYPLVRRINQRLLRKRPSLRVGHAGRTRNLTRMNEVTTV